MKITTTKFMHSKTMFKSMRALLSTLLVLLFCQLSAQDWEQLTQFDDTKLNNITFSSGLHGFVTAGDSENPIVLRTLDGCQSWDTITGTIEGYVYSTGCLNDTTWFLSSKSLNDAWIYKSTNQGDTWQKVDTMYLRTPEICFPNDSVGYAIQTSTEWAMVTKTTDRGDSWEMINSFTTEWGGAGVTDFVFINENIGYMVYESGIVYRTEDGGQTFEQVYKNFSYDLHALDFINPYDGFVVGEPKVADSISKDSGVVLQTSDGGETWSFTSIAGDCRDVVFLSPDSAFIAAGGGIYKTFNGGEDWFYSGSTEEYAISGLCFPFRYTGYAIGNQGNWSSAIYKNEMLFTTGIEESIVKEIEIAPNPATNYLRVLSPSIVNGNVTVYNLQGQVILKRKFSTNQIDISNLNSGTYIVEVSTQSWLKREKLVIK